MGLFGNRHTRISKRLRTIEKELTGVNSDICSLTRTVEKNGDEAVSEQLRRLKRRRATRLSYSTDKRSAPSSQHVTASPQQQERESEVSAQETPVSGATQGEEEQFASYFMSGGLERQEPLRKERHVQRNKAIFMVIFFVIVLILFVYFMISR
jgi:cobalamin biosynthesis Mg chelatase CobN